MMELAMLFLQQEGPANTDIYMIAGYVVVFGIMLIYLLSLVVRQRSLMKDLELLQDMEGEEK
jgi:hypothetical protein